MGELEGRTLKVYTAWVVLQHKSEIDMDDVPRSVDHYVSIVAVLDGEQVGEDAVGCQTADEVRLRLLELVMEIPSVKLVQVGQLVVLEVCHFLLQVVH